MEAEGIVLIVLAGVIIILATVIGLRVFAPAANLGPSNQLKSYGLYYCNGTLFKPTSPGVYYCPPCIIYDYNGVIYSDCPGEFNSTGATATITTTVTATATITTTVASTTTLTTTTTATVTTTVTRTTTTTATITSTTTTTVTRTTTVTITSTIWRPPRPIYPLYNILAGLSPVLIIGILLLLKREVPS